MVYSSQYAVLDVVKQKLRVSDATIDDELMTYMSEVDNFIRIDEKLPIGEFIDVKITEAFEYDLKGETLIHEPETV